MFMGLTRSWRGSESAWFFVSTSDKMMRHLEKVFGIFRVLVIGCPGALLPFFPTSGYVSSFTFCVLCDSNALPL